MIIDITIYTNGYFESHTISISSYKFNSDITEMKGVYPSFLYSRDNGRFCNQIDLEPIFLIRTNIFDSIRGDLRNGFVQTYFESSLGLINKFTFFRRNNFSLNVAIENRLFFRYRNNDPYVGAYLL